jgi:hypothetical protein
VAAEAVVDVVGDEDGDGDGTDDDRVDVLVRAGARRLVDGLQCGDGCYLVVKMMMLSLLVLVVSAKPCVDARVYLHFRVRVNRDENVRTEMR